MIEVREVDSLLPLAKIYKILPDAVIPIPVLDCFVMQLPELPTSVPRSSFWIIRKWASWDLGRGLHLPSLSPQLHLPRNQWLPSLWQKVCNFSGAPKPKCWAANLSRPLLYINSTPNSDFLMWGNLFIPLSTSLLLHDHPPKGDT